MSNFNLPFNVLTGELLKQIDELKEKLDAVRPLLNDSILNALYVEYTYESNRIEGNTLSLRETDIVINKGLTVGGKSLKEHLEATNHHEAILFIRDWVEQGNPISESVIKQVHSLVLRGIDNQNAGIYRRVPVAISGSKYTPPQPWLVPKQMEDLGIWMRESAALLHPVVFAAEIHERIATIHPFIDGNGRTARLIMNLVLLHHGYSIINIPGDSDSRLSYYNALEQCNLNGDKTAFLLLMAEYAHQSLKKMIQLLGEKP